MAQQEGLKALASRLLIEHGVFPRAGQIPDRLIIDIGHVDWRQIACPVELSQAYGIASVGRS